MRKGLFYICLLLVGVGLFAGCKSKKAVVASFSDLDGEWGVVEMNGKTLNPEETHQVLVFDVARQGLLVLIISYLNIMMLIKISLSSHR